MREEPCSCAEFGSGEEGRCVQVSGGVEKPTGVRVAVGVFLQLLLWTLGTLRAPPTRAQRGQGWVTVLCAAVIPGCLCPGTIYLYLMEIGKQKTYKRNPSVGIWCF